MMNREDFLQRATADIRQRFEAIQKPLPPVIHLSIGFPSIKGMSRRNRRIGECWPTVASSDGNAHIFISPVHSTGAAVLDTLMHELVHVVTPGEKHQAGFVRVCNQLGLTSGKPTSRSASPDLFKELECLNAKIGGYPVSTLAASLGDEKPQTTRLLKVECEECGYVCRITAKWIAAAGPPICPVDDRTMRVAA